MGWDFPHRLKDGQGCFLQENVGIAFKRSRFLKTKEFHHVFVVDNVGDINFYEDQTAYFPLYLYPEVLKGELFDKGTPRVKRSSNFAPQFLEAIKASLGAEPTQEDIFSYIYAALYSPIYRERYEEFLKIDFPRVPLPSNYEVFKRLSGLGKELVDLHLLKHPSLEKTDVGFPKSGSNKIEKVGYVEEGQRASINKEQYFEGVPKQVWKYQIGAYRVMEKYLKDRKARKLSLDEINHYMKVAKAIRLTIRLQQKD